MRQFKYGKDVVKRAARSGSLETFKSVVRILKTELDYDQVWLFQYITHSPD